MADATRISEISRFLLKYRNAGIFDAAAIDTAAANAKQCEGSTIPEGKPEEFVADLEALGPTFIKIGQALSTRADFVPPEYLVALERMQDSVKPVPIEQVRAVVEAEFGQKFSKLFIEFDEKPIGAASLGQVHRATLPNGREVAVKVQRPDIGKGIVDDLDLLRTVAGTVGRFGGVDHKYGFGEWVEEFRRVLLAELDYAREAQNLDIFWENLAAYPNLRVPRPIWDYTTQRVLTMEMVWGTKVTQVAPVARIEMPLRELCADLMRAYLDQVFVHGIIHADPHPGNVLLTDKPELVLVDLGMVAHVSPRMRDSLLKLVLATVDGRGEQAAEILIHLGARLDEFDEARFTRDIGQMVSHFSTVPGSRVSEGRLILDLARVGAASGLRPPPELALLGKTLLNLEAVANALDPALDTREILQDHMDSIARQRTKEFLSPNRLFSDMLELQELVREAPRRLSVLLRTLSDNRLRVHMTGFEESRVIESMQKIANRITTGLVTAALIIGGALMMRVDTRWHLLGYPALAIVMFLLGAGLGIAIVVSSLLSDRRARPVADKDPL
jgi:predicted unusual protein kinase regulating ubiquinone biosynthesis (AarF/ABC1/UbiB family)